MAVTRIADVIVPEVFNKYVIEKTAELSDLVKSGIISNNPELDRLALSGGTMINMPFWEDLDGDDEVLSDSGALTPAKITASQDRAVLFMRGKAWETNDLAKALAGSDPMAAIGNLVADYWARRRQALLLAMLSGIFKTTLKDTNALDISALQTGNTFSGSAFIDATQLMGDSASKLTAIAMHSQTYAAIKKQNLIETLKNSDGTKEVLTYMGHQIIVDDGCPVETVESAKVYTTYLFGQGAIGLGNGAAPVPTETDRDTLGGNDILVNRQHFVMHPRGVKWLGASQVGSSPTNEEIALAANWSPVYEPKNVRIVQFKHKL